LIGGVLAYSTKKAFRALGTGLYSGRIQLSFVLMFMLYNITEYGFRPLHPMWFVFIMLVVGLCKENMESRVAL